MKNTDYNDFLKTKEKTFISSGLMKTKKLNPMLFPFQKYAVKVALKKDASHCLKIADWEKLHSNLNGRIKYICILE